MAVIRQGAYRFAANQVISRLKLLVVDEIWWSQDETLWLNGQSTEQREA